MTSVWLLTFGLGTLLAFSHASILGTMIDLPKQFEHLPSKETLEFMKKLSPAEKKLIHEALEHCGGQYKSTDPEVLRFIELKDKNLHEKLFAGYDEVNKKLREVKSVDGTVFLGNLRSEFGEVNVKDSKEVDAAVKKWKKGYGDLEPKSKEEVAKLFPSVAQVLKPQDKS